MADYDTSREVFVALTDILEEETTEYLDELYSTIVSLTPVDTGHAKRNWVKNFDNLSFGEATIGISTSSGTEVISNEVPYVIFLEEGHSSQAPSGIVNVALDIVQFPTNKNY